MEPIQRLETALCGYFTGLAFSLTVAAMDWRVLNAVGFAGGMLIGSLLAIVYQVVIREEVAKIQLGFGVAVAVVGAWTCRALVMPPVLAVVCVCIIVGGQIAIRVAANVK